MQRPGAARGVHELIDAIAERDKERPLADRLDP